MPADTDYLDFKLRIAAATTLDHIEALRLELHTFPDSPEVRGMGETLYMRKQWVQHGQKAQAKEAQPEHEEPERSERPSFFASLIAKAKRAFDPSKHPRVKDGPGGKPDGQFASKGGGGGHFVVTKLTPTKQRADTGRMQRTRKTLSKTETGRLGEALGVAYLKSLGAKDASRMNARMANYATDLLFDHRVVEAKAGLVSNSERARRWRVTLGQPSAGEQAILDRMTPAQLKKWNATKVERAFERKAAVVQEYSKKLGRKVQGVTVAFIINPDTQTADIYEFPGFHKEISWNGPRAKVAYKGSVRYSLA